MRVNRCIASCPREVLVLSVGDVEVCLGIAVLLCETKVDDIDLVPALADTHQEVVGLDITVDEVTRMDVLNAGNLVSVV
jgi:hypothetical protein